ncbi:MAG: c-type cytochrome domain-containing protein [Gemmataceae bacterium]
MRVILGLILLLPGTLTAAAPPSAGGSLAGRARAVLQTHCHRCHGQDGTVEGGLNYVLDRDRLIARRKIVPGSPERSPLLTRIHTGKMPPPDEKTRPSPAEIKLLHDWIAAGAPAERPAGEGTLHRDADLLEWILTDLERLDPSARRFARYFSLAPQANAGASDDELKTYRHAVSKLLNSLSWHPRITIPQSVDARGLVLRIDLRDYLLDANAWNRLLNDYPFGILHDTGAARAVLVATATRMPVVRADWFVATASRAPLYYDLLQLPNNLGELERQLRVDVLLNIQQQRVVRAGFNSSGISRNNRILERHESLTGAYWRSYDFEAVPQNLLERNLLLPDRRNVFAYPLGPGGAETQFQHAGGEVIFHLPNGLHAYMLVNAANVRINKGPTEIVSDPKRPDRAVEAGVSCMHCHATGILPKDDQLRDHVRKSARAFSRVDRDLVEALHVPAKQMRKLMEADAKRFQSAVEKTGARVGSAEVVLMVTSRFEADVDLPGLAAELGVPGALLQSRLSAQESLARNLGALKVPGAVVARQVVVQAFGDLVRELNLGTSLEIGRGGEALPDATGEVDPLEAQSSPANALAFSPDRRFALIASQDRSVRLHDLAENRDLRRFIGHTASVWCVAFSPDGKRALSGSRDGTVRLWEVETGQELRRIEAHPGFVSAVAFSSDGSWVYSAGLDNALTAWNLQTGEAIATFQPPEGLRYAQSLDVAGSRLVVAGSGTLVVLDASSGRLLQRFTGHSGWVRRAVLSPRGDRLASAGDDGTVRYWDTATGKSLQVLRGHAGSVTAVAISSDGRYLLSGGADRTVRLWEASTGKELRAFRKHGQPLVGVAFSPRDGYTVSGSRDAALELWKIARR